MARTKTSTRNDTKTLTTSWRNRHLENIYSICLSCDGHYPFLFFVFSSLGWYSTFQYPDQDAYQYPYAEDFNADTIFHVSVSVKRYCLFFPYFKQCLHNIVIIQIKIQHLLFNMWWQLTFFNIYTYTCPIARLRCIIGRLWIWYIMRK